MSLEEDFIEDDLIEDDEEGLFEHHRIVADPKQGQLRIDKFLMARLPNVTRTDRKSTRLNSSHQ